MLKNEKAKGTWWLPDGAVMTGTLEYSDGKRPLLTVNGHLGEFDSVTAPLVFGNSDKLGKLTLFDNTFVQYVMSAAPSNTIAPKYILSGGHYKTQQHFHKVKFSLFGLNEWLDITGFKRQYTPPKLEYVSPDPIPFEIKDYCNGKIDFGLRWNFVNKYAMSDYQYPYVSIEYPDAIPLDAIIYDVNCFAKFISFCLFQQTYPLDITLQNTEVMNVKYIDNNPFYSTESKVRDPKYQLITYKRIEDNFTALLANWFELYRAEKSKPCLNLLLKVIRQRPILDLDVFLDITKALEIFSRSILDNLHTSGEFKAEREAVIDSLTPHQKELFEQAIKLAKEISLKERVLDLLNNHLQSDPEIKMPFSQTQEAFAKTVADTRNYHTHYGEKKTSVVVGDALIVTTRHVLGIVASSLSIRLQVPKNIAHEQKIIAVY